MFLYYERIYIYLKAKKLVSLLRTPTVLGIVEYILTSTEVQFTATFRIVH